MKKFYCFSNVDDICEYFGVKIAMYFAWLGMYTKWLVAPTVLGIITFILSMRSEATRDWCIFGFNIFNIVWATLYLEAWKRKSAELAYKWGTMDMPSEALKEPRPLYRVSHLLFDYENNLDSTCVLIGHQVCFHSTKMTCMSDIVVWFQVVRITVL